VAYLIALLTLFIKGSLSPIAAKKTKLNLSSSIAYSKLTPESSIC
jgi:hypothetical protein